MAPSSFFSPDNAPIFVAIGFTIFLLIFICFCVFQCYRQHKLCCKPRPTINNITPQHYPQQLNVSPFLGLQNALFQSALVQSGYGSQPMQQGCEPQPMLTMPYLGQPFTLGPLPTYQEAIDPAHPPNPKPDSQAAFNPSQPSCPLQPPVQPPQPNAPPAQPDFLAQPAYDPNYVTVPPQTGY
ncbi:protein shisa-5-like [Thunnus albacares]|uniref:protein shisa-5-like n=1 Tax=Thunnus albacares TaxID=8236 RepID=UPI001CF6A2B1|nr:protein shisa-5-like [Thunnus albacares]